MNVEHDVAADRQARLMREMIHRLDIDLLEFAYDRLGTTYELARETCQTCINATACTAWLAGADAGAPNFCPNLAALSRFRRV